ncbi:DUF4007 family protein [Sphaerisporangium album]|uniref:DUF4007 family protein n=1 Tax=Sphaerisporangium album TaxID=509200 RepID=UPI0015F11F99|nr:DUF4007 family protein [Sphaerisporangium album]
MPHSAARRPHPPTAPTAEQLLLFAADPPLATPACGDLPPNALAATCTPTWAQHRSNPPRYGWLGRAYNALLADPTLFAQHHSITELAAGSRNRAMSIRFWMRAFKLTTEHDQGTGQAHQVRLTERAHWLLNPDTGVDPYLEDPASLWLLHWWLLSPPCRAPAWHVAFNHMLSTFGKDQFHRRIASLATESRWRTPSAKVVDDELSCLVRMYTATRSWADQPLAHIEDIIDRPFATLGLLIVRNDGLLHLVNKSAVAVPAHVLAYACLAYSHALHPAATSIALPRLAGDIGGPGRVFRLYTAQLTERLRPVIETHPGIQIVESLGQDTLVFDRPAMPMGWELLAGLYPTTATIRHHPRPPPDLPAIAGRSRSTFEFLWIGSNRRIQRPRRVGADRPHPLAGPPPALRPAHAPPAALRRIQMSNAGKACALNRPLDSNSR